METDTVLAFHYLLTRIYLPMRVPEIPDIDKFIQMRNTTNLGLIYNVANPISKVAMMEASIS